MKNIVKVFLSLSLILCTFTPAHASIIWGNPADVLFDYTVQANGGDFYHHDAQPDPNNTYTHNWTNNISDTIKAGSIDDTASDIRHENFYNQGGSAILKASSGGGILGDTTINYVSGTLAITGETGGPNRFNENENAMNVRQKVTSAITRQFSVDEDTTISLSASLDGIIDFNLFDYGSNEAKLEDFSASALIVEFIEGSSSIQSLYEINLNQAMRNDSIDVPLHNKIDGNNVYYLLKTGIILNATMKNMKLNGYFPVYNDSGQVIAIVPDFSRLEIEGPFQIGEDGIPLTLTTEVSTAVPTPIPGSLLLFLSGLGSLNFVRCRFLRKSSC